MRILRITVLCTSGQFALSRRQCANVFDEPVLRKRSISSWPTVCPISVNTRWFCVRCRKPWICSPLHLPLDQRNYESGGSFITRPFHPHHISLFGLMDCSYVHTLQSEPSNSVEIATVPKPQREAEMCLFSTLPERSMCKSLSPRRPRQRKVAD